MRLGRFSSLLPPCILRIIFHKDLRSSSILNNKVAWMVQHNYSANRHPLILLTLNHTSCTGQFISDVPHAFSLSPPTRRSRNTYGSILILRTGPRSHSVYRFLRRQRIYQRSLKPDNRHYIHSVSRRAPTPDACDKIDKYTYD